MLSKDEIQQNYQEVTQTIADACKRVGRDNDVSIIAVTKTFPELLIQACIDLGITTVGENRARELRDKFNSYGTQVDWHMIGHLQTNKIKYIIDKVSLIHSVDSFKLAKAIDDEAIKNDRDIECLIQVNVVDEESKFGVTLDQLEPLLNKMKSLKRLKIAGLMNMAPFYNNPEEARSDFRHMKKIFEELKNKDYSNVEMKYLSMGMSNDYEIAVEEGSNMVRIGSRIFGRRDYR